VNLKIKIKLMSI